MADLRIEEYTVGDLGANCYFMVNTDTSEIVIIDPGGDADMLKRHITQKKYTPVAVLLTHGHVDHADDARAIRDAYSIPVYAHEAERETLEDPRINLSGAFGLSKRYSADVYAKDGEVLELAGFEIKVIHTPGHTAGGACYYFQNHKVLASGDTLFHGSVGRTDFPGGSMSQLVRGIRDKILTLPRDVEVLPGHMMRTTVGYECEYNPYL